MEKENLTTEYYEKNIEPDDKNLEIQSSDENVFDTIQDINENIDQPENILYDEEHYQSIETEENKTNNEIIQNTNQEFSRGPRPRQKTNIMPILCIFLGLAGGLAGGCISGMFTTPKIQPVQIEMTPTSNVSVQHSELSELVADVMPSMVSITTKSFENYDAFYGMYNKEVEGCGSGIIIGENDVELLIITNEHVINEANTVHIGFIDGTNIEGKIKSSDSNADIAIVAVPLTEISPTTLGNIKVASLGNSDNMKVGDYVIAIGNSYGYGESVTYGIISATDREVFDITGTSMSLLQTDAAINPGNSGGALINMKGEVIGINESKIADTEVEGMGFAIPITPQLEKINELSNIKTRDKVEVDERGYLNISCATVDYTAQDIYGIPAGAIVTDLNDNGAAANAGIKKRDVITSFDGQSIYSSEELVSKLENYAAGEKVQVIVQRNNGEEYKEIELTATLQKKK